MADTVDHHHLWILYFQIFYLLKFICNTNQYSWCCHGHLWTCAERQRLWVTAHTHSQLRSDKATFCLLVSALKTHTVNKCSFHSLFSATHLQFCAFFCWWFHWKNDPEAWCWVLSSVPECKCVMWRKFVFHKLFQAWVAVLLAVSSVLVNQPYTLN